MLCFIFSGGRSLDWPTMAESYMKWCSLTFRYERLHCDGVQLINESIKSLDFFLDSTHDPQHCWMQKHPFPCSGSGKQAVWVADLPSPSWRLQAQRAELLTPRLSPASLHHPWLSSAWWAFLRLWLHWHVDSVMALPSKQKGTHSRLNGVKRLNACKDDILLHYISSALNCDRI